MEGRVKELIDFIQYDYPRAANMLRWNWGKPDIEDIFLELLTYDSSKNKEGFQTEVFSAILELQEIHRESKGEQEKDPWSHIK